MSEASTTDSSAGLASKSAWAIAEQGIFAGSNFVMNVLLARWLAPAEYGAFAVAYAAMLLLATFHSGLVTEPLLVFGPGAYRDRQAGYFAVLLRAHGMVTVGIALALAIAAAVCDASGASSVAAALAVMALAQPLILLLWFMRQVCYVRGATPLAAISGATYLVLMVVGLKLGQLAELTSAGAYLAVMAVSSLAVATIIALRLCGDAWLHRPESGLWRDMVRRHWQYGRWIVASGAAGSAPLALTYFVLPVFGTIDQTGAMRAMANLMMPAHLANTAGANLLVTQLVRRRGTGGFGRLVRSAALLMVGGAILYWLLVGSFHGAIVHAIYGQFVAESNLLWLLGVIPVLGGVICIAGAVLRARERSSAIFAATAAGATVTITVGTVLIGMNGMWGAACANVLNSVVIATVLVALWRREVRANHRAAPAEEPMLAA